MFMLVMAAGGEHRLRIQHVPPAGSLYDGSDVESKNVPGES